jgi:hypothetical protein
VIRDVALFEAETNRKDCSLAQCTNAMLRYVASELLPNTNVAVRVSFSCRPYSGLASNVRVGSYSARLSPLTLLLRRERSRFSILVDSDKRKVASVTLFLASSVRLRRQASLNKYDATTHFVGQSTIFTLTGDRATGEAYCLAHHVTVDGGKRRLMLASLRYLDTFVKIDGSWLFAERCVYVDWLEERALS